MIRTGRPLLVLLLALAVSGCRTRPAVPTGPAVEPVPADFVQSYNQTLEPLDRLWARTVVRVDAPSADGKRERTQGEGYLQLIRPRNVSLSVGKYIDRMYFVLGSSDERYWWLDMLDQDDKVALVGLHEEVTPELAGELGVPVHPLDLLDLLALTPVADDAAVAWSGDLVAVTMPTRLGGVREVGIEPGTFNAQRVVLRDASGQLIARSELSMHRAARVSLGGFAGVPGRAVIELPTIDATVTLDLSDAENLGGKPREVVFDLPTLLERAYRIDRVIDLDDPATRAELRSLAEPSQPVDVR